MSDPLRSINFVPLKPPIAATLYLAALAHPNDREEFELFTLSMAAIATGNKLSRQQKRSIDRTTRIVYEIRQPAAVVARQACQGVFDEVSAPLFEGLRKVGILFEIPQSASVRQAALAMSSRLPKHNKLPNFWNHVWNPSRNSLHLGIGFVHHAFKGPDAAPSMSSLVSRPAWISDAIRNAAFWRVVLQKRIDGLDELIDIKWQRNLTSELADRALPDSRYRIEKPGNWGDLTDED